jgi:hypothetical protein
VVRQAHHALSKVEGRGATKAGLPFRRLVHPVLVEDDLGGLPRRVLHERELRIDHREEEARLGLSEDLEAGLARG